MRASGSSGPLVNCRMVNQDDDPFLKLPFLFLKLPFFIDA